MPPNPDVQVLFPGMCDYSRLHDKEAADEQRNQPTSSEMFSGGSDVILRVPEGAGNPGQRGGMGEALGALPASNCPGPRAKAGRQPREADKGKALDSP